MPPRCTRTRGRRRGVALELSSSARRAGRDRDLARARRVMRLRAALVHELIRVSPTINSWAIGSRFTSTNRTVSPGAASISCSENVEKRMSITTSRGPASPAPATIAVGAGGHRGRQRDGGDALGGAAVHRSYRDRAARLDRAYAAPATAITAIAAASPGQRHVGGRRPRVERRAERPGSSGLSARRSTRGRRPPPCRSPGSRLRSR